MSESKKRILLMVLDGAGDRACPELRGLTPLQHVRTPNLDWFVEHGIAGLCDPISPGVRAGSDTAHLSILGYDARAVYTGRGPFEAIGAGVDIQPGDVAFRCNFATVNSDMEILDRRAGRIREPETEQLAEALDGIEIDGIECSVHAGTEHRAVLVLRGDGLSPDVTDCDPGEDSHLLRCEPLTEEAQLTADVVNGFLDLLSLWFLSTFSKKPMHFFGFTGLLTFFIGGLLAVWIIIEKLVQQAHGVPYRPVTDQPLFYLALVALVIGVLLFLAGFLGEMISRTSQDRNHYNIKDKF